LEPQTTLYECLNKPEPIPRILDVASEHFLLSIALLHLVDSAREFGSSKPELRYGFI
jgi:hypothetical protein